MKMNRLDKVLSKFEKEEEYYMVFELTNNEHIEIRYVNEVFLLGNYWQRKKGMSIISIDTVESLIRDIENEST